MSTIAETQTRDERVAELYVRLASIESLREAVRAELRAEGESPPTGVNQCGHPNRPVAGLLDKQGRPSCFDCSRESHGVKPEELRRALLHEVDKNEWSDEYRPLRFTPMTGDLR